VAITITTPAPAAPLAVATARLEVLTNGFGRVTPDLNGAQLQLGKSYRLRAIPARGQVFAGWTGLPSIASNSTLNFAMQSNLTLVAAFVTNPFPRVKGSYA